MNPVTVEHDGFSVTSTGESEADVRTALGIVAESPAPAETLAEAPPEPEAQPPADEPEAVKEPKADDKPRDAKGQFTRKDWQKRVDKLTWEKNEAARREAAARAELDAIKAAQAPKTPVVAPQGFPAWEDWAKTHDGSDYSAYLAEMIEAVADAKVSARLEAERKAQEEHALQAQARSAMDKLTDLGRKTFPNWDETITAMADRGDRFAPHVAAIINDALDDDDPFSHRLVYHLASHPDDLERLNGLSVLAAAREAHRLARPLAPAVRGSGAPAESLAPPPRKPIGGGPAAPTVEDPGDDEPVEAFIARNNALDRKRGRL